MTFMRKHAFALGCIAIVAIAAVCVFGLDAGHAAPILGGLFMADASVAPTLETQIKDLSVQLGKAADAVKEQGEKATAEFKSLGDATKETKQKADEALVKHGEISERMTALEQEVAKRHAGGETKIKSVGQEAIDSDEFKALFAKGVAFKGRARMSTKAIISALGTDADGSVGALLLPDRQAGIIAPPQRTMTVRSLLTPGTTASNSIEYVKETGFTNNAGTVSETAGTAKPSSEIKMAVVNSPVTTIAHWVRATKQILSDAPMLRSYIDGRLRYGLAYKEELQLLMGDGTGTNLNGIFTQASAYNQAVPDDLAIVTRVDIIRLAILQGFLAELPPTGIVLNPTDWAKIELTKTAEGAYIMANPQGTIEPRLWRRPVVETQAMTVDNFLTGAFQQGAQIFDREDANVEVSTEDQDNFIKNLVTILAEERLGLAVYRPEAFVKGTFTAALAG
jgi:HK97 family phage major capsid protein